MERPPSGAPVQDNLNQGKKAEDGKSPVVSCLQLSADFQGILDDLQMDPSPGKHVEKFDQKPVTSRGGAAAHSGCSGVNHTGGPAKPSSSSSTEALKPEPARRKRHYDSVAVRQYISRQQTERRRRQTEERRSQQEESDRRNQRLQQLYRKQKQGFTRPPADATTTLESTHRSLLDTYTKLLPEQSQLDMMEVPLSPYSSTYQQVCSALLQRIEDNGTSELVKV